MAKKKAANQDGNEENLENTNQEQNKNQENTQPEPTEANPAEKEIDQSLPADQHSRSETESHPELHESEDEILANDVPIFKPGTEYKKGECIRYRGATFEALSDHVGDNAPDLWKPVDEATAIANKAGKKESASSEPAVQGGDDKPRPKEAFV